MSENKNCFFCGLEQQECSSEDYGAMRRFDCMNCGSYKAKETALSNLERRSDALCKKLAFAHKLSGRSDSQKRNEIIFDKAALKLWIDQVQLPAVQEQAENLIRLIGDEVVFPNMALCEDVKKLAVLVGSAGRDGLQYIAEELSEKKLLRFTLNGPVSSPISLHLTFDGWQEYDRVKRGVNNGRLAFMAMKYEDPDLDKLYQYFIVPAVEETGFEAQILDKVLKAGLIDNQLRERIRSCKFMLSNLTHGNNGAYWEAGYAEGLGKPVIYLCEKSEWDCVKTHFDTNHHVTIIYDKKAPKEGMEKLKATIRMTFPIESIAESPDG